MKKIRSAMLQQKNLYLSLYNKCPEQISPEETFNIKQKLSLFVLFAK